MFRPASAVVLVYTTVIFATGLYVVDTNQDRNSARLCNVTNDARQALRNLVIDARDTVQQAPDERISPEDKKESLEFYNRQLSKIKIVNCPAEPTLKPFD